MNTCCQSTLPPKTLQELLERTNNLSGKKLGEIASQENFILNNDLSTNKGIIGNLIEKALGANAASKPEPDFSFLNIELKTIPVNAQGIVQETTYVTVVQLLNTTTWQESIVKKKLSKVLFVPYLDDENIPLADRIIGAGILWQMDKKIEKILQTDYNELMDYIAYGKISKLTAKVGKFLHIRPKALKFVANDYAMNEDGDIVPTIKRGFYLRREFTQSILGENLIS